MRKICNFTEKIRGKESEDMHVRFQESIALINEVELLIPLVL